MENFIFVVPCFNEEKRLNKFLWEQVLAIPNIELYFVNDGSKDSTEVIIKELASKFKNASNHSNEKNLGKAETIRLAFQKKLLENPNCSGLGFIDSDSAINMEDVIRIVEEFKLKSKNEEFDSVWSSRVKLAGRKIERNSSRHYIGRIISSLISMKIGNIPYDTQSGLKIFKPNQKLKLILVESFKTRWLFEIEMLIRWRKENGHDILIWEMPLNEWKEIPGSKINLRESLRVLVELSKIILSRI
jgi:glycosyltransferase involved in cell wall biosynthesis